MKSDIESFKYLFQKEDGGIIGEKCISVQQIAPIKELSNSQALVIFLLILGQEKLEFYGYLYLDFDQFTRY